MQLVVGRIGPAHGIRGDVLVEPRTDDPGTRFAPGVVLVTDPAERGPLEVADARDHSGRLLVRFASVADRSAAEALRGTWLVVDVPDDERPEDPEEYYDHQLVGLRAVSPQGVDLGEVTDVVHLPAQDLLAVQTPGGERLVPFVAAIVPVVDLDGGRVVVDAPPGLLDDGEGGA
ncbi:ribosome maturation factor RimM [Motilibacter rhizosphaerae]|uniref:ribosome maturation factor RimM n=1 Tax=Motilibacter rhizosphaerae TaxID=598652 RepID=UPI00102BB683|nr:ribosome maturation factor RimM [Motilibacter rhizosphaerae]